MNRDCFWLMEDQFSRLAPLLPTDTRGKPRVDDRRVIKARAAAMPDVPTSAEVGLPDLLSGVWYAMVGPPKLKPELRDQIAKATIEVLKMPDVQQRFRTLNVEPDGRTPAETAAFIKDEARRWGEVIRANNITAE